MSEEERIKPDETNTKQIRMIGLNIIITITILNVNGLNTLIKRPKL